MLNPIIEALGGIDLSGFDFEKHSVVIRLAGRPWLVGKPHDIKNQKYEGYYRCDHLGHLVGACISAPFAHDADAALRILATAAERSPRRGEIATVVETLKLRCTIEIVNQ